MRRRSEGEPTGDAGMPARRIERSFVSAGDEGEPGLTGRCSGAGAAVLKMEASALLLMPARAWIAHNAKAPSRALIILKPHSTVPRYFTSYQKQTQISPPSPAPPFSPPPSGPLPPA